MSFNTGSERPGAGKKAVEGTSGGKPFNASQAGFNQVDASQPIDPDIIPDDPEETLLGSNLTVTTRGLLPHEYIPPASQIEEEDVFLGNEVMSFGGSISFSNTQITIEDIYQTTFSDSGLFIVSGLFTQSNTPVIISGISDQISTGIEHFVGEETISYSNTIVIVDPVIYNLLIEEEYLTNEGTLSV